MFPIYHYDEDSRFENSDEDDIRDNNALINNKNLERLINIKEIDINDELVTNNFLFQDLRALLEKLKKSKTYAENNEIQVNLIKSRLGNFKEEIEDMSKEEKETERPNEIVNIVEKILEFNRQQLGQGIKILTPSQMISRLPISLVQLKAGNNSEKLKNEIRQLLYSLYRSKKLTKKNKLKFDRHYLKHGNNFYEH